MITREDATKYFNGIKPKYLKEFTNTTPEGNTIHGFICKKPNYYLGSMLIDKITTSEGVECEDLHFVQSMPKIHYYSHKNEIFSDEPITYTAYEKLDGSCLILYGLYIDGELLEIVPKTRGIPVADKHIIEMYNELDHSNIQTFFESSKPESHPSLFFELYGQLNLHSIFYPEVRISLGFIGGSFDKELFDENLKVFLSMQFDFKLPSKIFTLTYTEEKFWKVYVQPGIYKYYLLKGIDESQKESFNIVEYPTAYDAINTIKDYITTINKEYSKVHGYGLLEGVCLDAWDGSGDKFTYFKIKSSDIEERCRTENGIPRRIILKEVYKYFDEFGSQAKEIYKKDDKHAYNYIMKNLSEEFDKIALENKKTKNRVKTVFLDVLEAKEPPIGLQEICQNLVEEYPDQTPVDYIRLFAQEYPEKKRQANMAFQIFERLV